MSVQDIPADLSPANALKRGKRDPLTRDEEWRYAEKALTWYGWGSPVGFSIFLVAAAIVVVAVRWTITGL